MSEIHHVPLGMQPLIPYLTVKDAVGAIDFYVQGLGAAERMRMTMPDAPVVLHAELELAGCVFMLGEENPDWGMLGPQGLGGTPVSMMVYVADCDAALDRATAAGASVTRPAADMFWGDRMGQVQDPYGHRWTFATHLRDPSPEEMEAGLRAMAGG